MTYTATTMPCRDVNQLHPTLLKGYNELIRRGTALGYKIGVNQTYRSVAYQNQLYAQGRTTPGMIVTNATGGNSSHNYRLAYDVHRLDRIDAFYNGDNWFGKVGAIWVSMGGKYGGTNDGPHMEFLNGRAISWYKAGNLMPDTTQMPWELEVENMTTAELEKTIYNVLDKYFEGKNSQPNSQWFVNEFTGKSALVRSVTDGTSPQGFATREQTTAMILRALGK